MPVRHRKIWGSVNDAAKHVLVRHELVKNEHTVALTFLFEGRFRLPFFIPILPCDRGLFRVRKRAILAAIRA